MPYDVNHVLKHADVAGWALGALDPIDAQAFEAHLRSCGQCQAALAEFEPVAQALGRAAPAVEPPDDLEARTIARVLAAAADEQRATKVQPVRGAFRPAADEEYAARVRPIPDTLLPVAEPRLAGAKVIRFPRWHGHGRLAAAAGAVAAAIIAVLLIVPGLGRGRPANAATFQLGPQSGQTASGTATDRQDASGSWDITLSVQHLANLGDVAYYECWYVSPSRPGHARQIVSAGTFVVGANGSGTFSMTSEADPRQFSTMEIIAERPGGTSTQGQVILSGTART